MRILFLLILSSLLNVVTAGNSNAQSPVKIETTLKKSYNGSDVSCAGTNDGQITVTASGGSGVYEYSKDNGVSYANSNILTGLQSGANTIVKVRDAGNHINISNAEYIYINNVMPVVVNSFNRETYYNNGEDGISCAGKSDGKISINAHGGTAPYTYSLDEGITFQSSNSFNHLSAGTYIGLVKDANGCIAYSSENLTLIAPKPITVKVLSMTAENCFDPCGTITIKGEGSTGDYQFKIDSESFFWVGTNSEHTFTELSVGQHLIVIKDNNHGCTGEYEFEIPKPMAVSISGKDFACSEEDAVLFINIFGSPLLHENETFSAEFTDDRGNVYNEANLVLGANAISLGNLPTTTTYKLNYVLGSITKKYYKYEGSYKIEVNYPGTWLGKSEDWHDPNNWTCGKIPTTTTNVKIKPTSNNPVIFKSSGEVKSISTSGDINITVKSKLSISGELEEVYSLDVSTGTLEFIGDRQHITGRMFKNRTIHNLIVSNKTELRVGKYEEDNLNITGDLTFGIADASLYTGDNITLKSTISGTANLGVVGEENIIIGKFIVEKYINTGTDKSLGQHGKAWVLLATPTIGSTIYESWQESGNTTGDTPIANNNKGFGTLLTTGYKNVLENGFDLYTAPGPSIKTYNFKTRSYDQGPERTYDDIYNKKGYLVLVRGDRSVNTSDSPATPVVLRTKGEVIIGTTTAIDVEENNWESIGNPYASRISINKINRTNGVDEYISLWDPKLGGAYGLGGFQTLYSKGGNYFAMPGGGSYGEEPVTYIESGQAFFVQATEQDGTVYFTEDSKVPSEKGKMERGGGVTSKFPSLKSSLFALGSGEAILVDGNILLTGNFSNGIDGHDARKMLNSAENFAIISSGQLLTVESRKQIISEDKLMFNMTGMRDQDYFLKFRAEDIYMPNMEAWLVDAFTSTKTLLDLNRTTEYRFTISNQPGAAASNRFMIVFKIAEGGILPVTFTEVKATLNNENVLVEWSVEAESNLKQYEVEKSLDGRVFSKIATVLADNKNGGKYQWLDQTPVSGLNYYRIRSVDLDGKTSLTQIVKVKTENSSGSISVYPNPIAHGTLNVQLANQPEGIYHLRLLNPVGQVLLTTKINHAGGNHTEKINWDYSMPRGMYTLEITQAQVGVKIIKIMY